MKEIAQKLIKKRSLKTAEYLELLESFSPELAEFLAQKAREEKERNIIYW